MSFPRRPTARVTFLSGKVTKAIGAGHDGRANVRLARLPVASCAKRAGANSHVPVLGHRALLPLGAAMLGVMRRRRKLASTRPSMACHLIGKRYVLRSVLSPARRLLRQRPSRILRAGDRAPLNN